MPLQPSTTPSHVLTVSQQNYGLTVEENNWDLTLAYAAVSVTPNSVTSSTTSNGTANLSISNVTTATATVSGTLTAAHIHGNLAGVVYTHIRAGEALAKGDPVYVSGYQNGTNEPIVSKADASNAAKMPAVGIMDAAVANNGSGHMVIIGTIADINTAAYAVNAELYVKAGGGLTATAPSDRAQPVARVERSNTNNGAIIVTIEDLSATNATNNTLVRRDGTGAAKFGGLAIPSFTSGNVVTVTTNGAFTNTPTSGIDTRPSFPNTDVTNATSLAIANRIVKRDGIGDIAVSGLIANTISVGDIDANGYVSVGGFESPAITFTDSVYLNALTYIFGAGADQAFKDALGITFSNITDSTSGTAYLNLSTLTLSEPIVSGLQPKLIFTANPSAVGDGQQILWQWYDGTTTTTTASISSEATGSTTDKLIFQTTAGGALGASLDLTNTLATFSGSISSLGESYRTSSTFTYAAGVAATHRTALGLTTLATTTPAANVATFLATPSSANLAAAVTGETGTGALVFGTSPTIDAPTISGSAAFTSTTRPTSAGTGTPAATSLMTRTDGDTRYKSITEFQVSSTPTVISGSLSGIGSVSSPTYVIGFDAAPVAGRSYGQIIGAPSIVSINTLDYGYYSGTGNGSIIDFSIPWSLFFKLIFNRSAITDDIIRVGVGELFAASITLPSFGANGFGIRLNRKAGSTTVFEVRIIGKVRTGWEANFVTGASNASPIVITSANNGLQNGDLVEVVGVGGNTAANGIFTVANATVSTFELVGSTGNGAFTSGGAYHKISQPVEITTARAYDIELENTANSGIYGCNLRINGQLVLSMTGINRFHNVTNVRSGAGIRAGIQNISSPASNYAYMISSIRFVQPL